MISKSNVKLCCVRDGVSQNPRPIIVCSTSCIYLFLQIIVKKFIFHFAVRHLLRSAVSQTKSMVKQWYNSRTASKSPSRSSLRRSRFKLLLSQYWWRLWSASWRNLQDQLPKLLFHLDTVLRFSQGSGQFTFCMTISLRASTQGRSGGGGGGEGKRACN